MLRPAILRGVMRGMPVLDAKDIEEAFELTMGMDAKFFLVRVNGEEKGVVLFRREGNNWSMHLCLTTWFSHTREAVTRCINEVISPATPVSAEFVVSNRAVSRLLDDLGFEPPEKFFGYYTDQMWHSRKLYQC